MREIQRTWGGTLSAVGQRRSGWKPGYAVIWTNARAAKLLKKLAPFLRVKAEHAAILLTFQGRLTKVTRRRDKRGHLLRLSRRELQVREDFFMRMRRLNKRGSAATRDSRGKSGPSTRSWVSPEYLAGFMDGEGSLMIARAKSTSSDRFHYRARIAVSNTNRAVLRSIQRRYGGILADQPARTVRWREGYQLVWTAGMVEGILNATASHLRIKQKQAHILDMFLRHQSRTRQGRSGPHGRYFARHPERVIAIRERFRGRVMELNRRGAGRQERIRAAPRT